MTPGIPALIGFQEVVTWMGTEVLTLAEVLPESPRAVIVGLNPAPPSVAAGHYYQGRVGRTQLMRLVTQGAMSAPTGTFFEGVASLANVGFTDLVRRPSIRENDVSRVELAHGRAMLERTLADLDVPQVICVFRQPAEALLGSPTTLGYQEERTSWGARVFRMPGPFEKREVVAAVMATIRL